MQNNTIVLAYHSIRKVDRGSVYSSLCVSPEQFEWQLRHLTRCGYRNVPASDLIERPEVIEKRFVITFDDGFEDNFSIALPIMRKLGCRGLVFLTTGFIRDKRPSENAGSEGLPYLTWAEVIEMERIGFEFGSHLSNHKRLSGIDEDEMRDEILGSKDIIEQRLEHEIKHFCAPFGDYPLSAYRIVRESYQRSYLTYGYRSVYKQYLDVVSRIGVYGQNTKAQFKLKLMRDRYRLI